ncbi:uncharacterized protein LOC133713824 [Rosa rugosa]|uniref:uncharacterized protein LOC133713824 n=1 Tax=Rosa rugosa TaxID=74645 RepID=UPI002B40218A|nr:uncharacterized protein LOC133713824 [Rosa rugosa]
MSQAPQSGAPAPRKRRFKPKAPRPKAEVKPDPEEEEQASHAEKERELLRRFHEQSLRVKPKHEKKEKPVEVAFGSGGQSSSTIRSYGAPRGANGGGFNPVIQEEKEYKSPFDIYGHYPISLPLRQPSSEDPAILNQQEFGDGSEESIYDENATPAADDLDLKEENRATSMFFLHLPPTLPILKQPAGQQVTSSSGAPGGAHNTEKPCSLGELPAGFMGKMLVYRSGAIKLKLGDTLYDVSTGMNCDFAQDVVAINTTEKKCCTIGELNKRAVVTPDIDSVLNSLEDL